MNTVRIHVQLLTVRSLNLHFKIYTTFVTNVLQMCNNKHKEYGNEHFYSSHFQWNTNGAFPLQRGARCKRAEPCRARFWLRFHLA